MTNHTDNPAKKLQFFPIYARHLALIEERKELKRKYDQTNDFFEQMRIKLQAMELTWAIRDVEAYLNNNDLLCRLLPKIWEEFVHEMRQT